jgi:hypothetical protein
MQHYIQGPRPSTSWYPMLPLKKNSCLT